MELIEGQIVQMSPIGSGHAARVKRWSAVLGARLHARAIVSVQDPVQLSKDSEPRPDVAPTVADLLGPEAA